MPNVFQQNWAPQQMPATNLALSNNFANYNLGQMGGGYQQQQYPPQQQQYPPQQYPQQQYPQQEYPMQNYPQQEYPPQNEQNTNQQMMMEEWFDNILRIEKIKILIKVGKEI